MFFEFFILESTCLGHVFLNYLRYILLFLLSRWVVKTYVFRRFNDFENGRAFACFLFSCLFTSTGLFWTDNAPWRVNLLSWRLIFLSLCTRRLSLFLKFHLRVEQAFLWNTQQLRLSSLTKQYSSLLTIWRLNLHVLYIDFISKYVLLLSDCLIYQLYFFLLLYRGEYLLLLILNVKNSLILTEKLESWMRVVEFWIW